MVRSMALSVAWMVVVATAARADWPAFRGSNGDGHVDAAGLPLQWSETENVKWKTPIPDRGWSTPVVLGGQVWLTTASTDGHDFFAIGVDAQSGKILFNVKVFHSDNPEPLGNPVNTYASPSPVIEPGRVYVHFGSYGTACLDTASGKVIWQRTDLPCRHFRGPGSSPIMFEDLLIVTFDGIDLQYMAALDRKTGKTVWRTDRSADWHDLDHTGKPTGDGDFRKAYSTPLVINANGRQQLISSGAKAAYSYDPRTGKELWKVSHKGYSAAAMPVFGEGLVYFTTGFGKTELWAVRADGAGDIPESKVAWKMSKAAPRAPTPILVDKLLYVLADEGMLTCLEATTGTEVWKERLPGKYCSSPIYADGRLYYCNQDGVITVLKPGRTFQTLASSKLESGFMASPAVSGKAIFLRTKTDLYRIESSGN